MLRRSKWCLIKLPKAIISMQVGLPLLLPPSLPHSLQTGLQTDRRIQIHGFQTQQCQPKLDWYIYPSFHSFFPTYSLTYSGEEKEGLSHHHHHHRPEYFQTNKQLTKKKRKKKRRKSRLCCDRWGSLLLLNSSKARCQIMSSSRSNKPTVSVFPTTTGTGMNFVWVLLKESTS